jgi:Pregnancy-associated plasma protein-A
LLLFSSPTSQLLVTAVGFWLGLVFTWQNGCNPPGDGIADTPAEKQLHQTCADPNRDSCPNDPGKDPMYNYMALSPDACANQFTIDQLLRMRAMWFIYREPIVAPPTKSPSMAPVPAPVKTAPVAVPAAVPVTVPGMMMMMMMGMN